MAQLTRDQLPRHIRQSLNELEWSSADDIDRLVGISRRIGRSLLRHHLRFDYVRALIAKTAKDTGFTENVDVDLFARAGLLHGMEDLKARTKNHTLVYSRVF